MTLPVYAEPMHVWCRSCGQQLELRAESQAEQAMRIVNRLCRVCDCLLRMWYREAEGA